MRETKSLFINEDNLGLVTDFYQLTMAAGYLQNDMNHPATFELFIRRLLENRPFLIVAGLEQAVHYLAGLRCERDNLLSLGYLTPDAGTLAARIHLFCGRSMSAASTLRC